MALGGHRSLTARCPLSVRLAAIAPLGHQREQVATRKRSPFSPTDHLAAIFLDDDGYHCRASDAGLAHRCTGLGGSPSSQIGGDGTGAVSELARMNRVVTAGQLTASIAHEIRQPLSSISTFGNAGLNWLKREPPNLDGARSGPENIVQAVRRADDVIKSVTALFKNEPTTRTEVYVNALIQQILISTAQIRDAHVILLESNFVENPPPYVMADPGQLQQVVLNLISNAIEAMSASQRGARILRVDTNVEQANSVIITVADSGPGIDPEITEQLFKPFFTTKSSGMGLGLSICKTIIEAHHGKLTVASREPHGAVFRVELPLHRHERN
jgi:signal transduction histidine kinase